jgi:hypothetical protein
LDANDRGRRLHSGISLRSCVKRPCCSTSSQAGRSQWLGDLLNGGNDVIDVAAALPDVVCADHHGLLPRPRRDAAFQPGLVGATYERDLGRHMPPLVVLRVLAAHRVQDLVDCAWPTRRH